MVFPRSFPLAPLMRRLAAASLFLLVAAAACEPVPRPIPAAAPAVPGLERALALRWPDPERGQVDRTWFDARRLSVPKCAGEVPVVTSDSIGPLRAGATLAETLARCPKTLAAWDWGDEGIPEPALLVRLGPVVAELVLMDTLPESRVYRIVLRDSLARTAAGVGPGSPVAALERAYGRPAALGEAECVLLAGFAAAPRLGWRLTWDRRTQCGKFDHGGEPPVSGAAYPADARVTALILSSDPEP